MELWLTKRHLPACDAAGVGVLVIKMYDQPMLLGCGDRDIHHLEERFREVRLAQALARVDEEATHALPAPFRPPASGFRRPTGGRSRTRKGRSRWGGCWSWVVPDAEGRKTSNDGWSLPMAFGRQPSTAWFAESKMPTTSPGSSPFSMWKPSRRIRLTELELSERTPWMMRPMPSLSKP